MISKLFCVYFSFSFEILAFFFVVSEKVRIFAPTKPVHVWARAVKDIDGILRPTKPFVGLAKGKGVYGRYISVFFKLRNFESISQEVIATVSVCVRADYIPTTAIYILIMCSYVLII